jgi:hypothetical protein
MPRRISEERTRKEMIDPSIHPGGQSGRRPQWETAGWYLRDQAEEQVEVPDYGK